MPDLTLRICGIPLRLAADDRVFVEEARRRYEPFVAAGAPEIRLELEIVPRRLRAAMPEPRVIRRGRRIRVERHDLEFDLAPGTLRGRVLRSPAALDSTLRIALSFALVERGGFLCHSAAVGGRLFPGVSGAGKSTLGLSVPPRRLLADELVGVTGLKLHGTPFWGDFRAGRNNVSRRLEAIFFLDRRAPRGVRPVGKAEALGRLLGCVICFDDDGRAGRVILDAVRACVDKAPPFVLSYDARKTGFPGVEWMIKVALRRTVS